MNLDYEALAAKGNPFEGLSRQQMDWMIVYLAFVREPVMTLGDIEFQWGVQFSEDMPIFEAVRAADCIRYELRCHKERPRRIKNALLVLGCTALLLLVVIEFVRMPRLDRIRRAEKVTAEARLDAQAAERKAEECRTDASRRIQTAMQDAKMRIQAAETKALERVQSAEKHAQTRIKLAEIGVCKMLNERIAGYICAAQSGTLDKTDALVKIKEQIQVLSGPAEVPTSGELSEIVQQANRALSRSGESWNTVYDSAEQLRKFLVRDQGRKQNLKMNDVLRFDLTDLMVNCYRRALDSGCGVAGFQLFLLYDGPSFCKGSIYSDEPKLGISSELISARNMVLAKSALMRACEMGDYDALSVALYLSEWRRDISFDFTEKWKYLCQLGTHANVRPEQLYRIARVFLEWIQTGTGSRYKELHEMKNNAVHYFRQASARGNIDAKRWLIANGYSFK